MRFARRLRFAFVPAPCQSSAFAPACCCHRPRRTSLSAWRRLGRESRAIGRCMTGTRMVSRASRGRTTLKAVQPPPQNLRAGGLHLRSVMIGLSLSSVRTCACQHLPSRSAVQPGKAPALLLDDLIDFFPHSGSLGGLPDIAGLSGGFFARPAVAFYSNMWL